MTEYKVGQRVCLVSDGGYHGDAYFPGALGTVTELSHHGVHVIADDAGDGPLFFYHREVKPAPSEVSISDIETLEELEAISEDVVNKPSHYARWAIEPITFIMRNGFEFWRGNVVKYASRAGFKLYEGQDQVQSEITDLKKVIRYAEMRINQLSGETVL